MESYFELVVETLTAAGYRWYETANFCRAPDRGNGRDLRSHHNLGYWLGHDYLGLGVGAVSTIENRRWRNAPSLRGYLDGARGRSARRRASSRSFRPTGARPSASCSACGSTSRFAFGEVEDALDAGELGRLERLGLAERSGDGS